MGHVLCLDWGSSHLRIHRAEGGSIRETRQAATGAKGLSGPELYRVALRAEAGDWLADATRILVTGMATRRGGWRETPYLPCPADPAGLLGAAVEDKIDGVPVTLLPGIMDPEGPDVMRGEEVQILGMGLRDAVAILPGTHSKWVEIRGGAIVRFRTFLTGEIYALLRERSLAGQLAEGDDAGPGFEAGLDSTETAPFAAIFGARAAVLTGGMSPAAVPGYLSGLLIGAEVTEGLALMPPGAMHLHLAGEPDLVALYVRALARQGHADPYPAERASVAGFERLLALP